MQTNISSFAVAELIRTQRTALLSNWRVKVRQIPPARSLDIPSLNDHIPVLLDELVSTLALAKDDAALDRITHGSSPIHGLQRLENGYQIEEVVAEYNILRACIHELAQMNGLVLAHDAVRILNAVLDTAIGAAIKAFVVQQAQDVQRRREDYLAFVAHDLRTPLGAITLATQIVEKESARKEMSPRAQIALGTMQRNLGYLTTLVNKVLEENVNIETESGIRMQRRRIDLWPLVESLIHDLHPVAGSGSVALINAVPDDLTIFADAALLRRIFQNLIANAIRHAPHGEIRISATSVPSQRQVVCTVADNGTGISAERLPYVFDKFETDGLRSTDMGLGLTICKTFVEAHGGTIMVESDPGQGTRFSFMLPQP